MDMGFFLGGYFQSVFRDFESNLETKVDFIKKILN